MKKISSNIYLPNEIQLAHDLANALKDRNSLKFYLGVATGECCYHVSIFFINPVGRAFWLFVKPPLLTQVLCKARLCEKKYAPSAASEEDFFSANP